VLQTELDLPAALRLLADGTRLRILGLLEREELTVGELSRALGLAQSRVSNHLRLLREAELLSERHAGSSTHLRLAPGLLEDVQRAPAAPGDRESPSRLWFALWQTLRKNLAELPEHAADLGRLSFVLQERSRLPDFFDVVAGEYDKRAGDFETGQGRQRAAAQLFPSTMTLADVGCGTGYMAESLAAHRGKLILIDRSEQMLLRARERLAHAQAQLEFRQGSTEALPLADGEVDGLVCGLVLHHLAELDRPLAECFRALKPGGRAVALELHPHGEAWMQTELGDRHLGLEPQDVLAAFRRAGFSDVHLDAAQDRYRPKHPDGRLVSLPLFTVGGQKPHSNPRP
jgi:ubiquinone/menaquinone biosynthesis C-methylase UbiE/DNA-binding transcriptional ArsR family regulator